MKKNIAYLRNRLSQLSWVIKSLHIRNKINGGIIIVSILFAIIIIRGKSDLNLVYKTTHQIQTHLSYLIDLIQIQSDSTVIKNDLDMLSRNDNGLNISQQIQASRRLIERVNSLTGLNPIYAESLSIIANSANKIQEQFKNIDNSDANKTDDYKKGILLEIAIIQSDCTTLIQKLSEQIKTLQQEQRRELNHLEATITITGILLFMLSVILFYIITNSILKPVLSLHSVVNELKAGNLDARAPIYSDDEIGELTDAVNEMTNSLIMAHEALLVQNEKLEDLVVQRTESLNNSLSDLKLEMLVRNAAEDDLRIKEERYHTLIENIQDGVILYEAIDDGSNFIVKDCNHAVEKIENINRHIIINQKITELFPGVEAFGLLKVLRQVYLTGFPEELPLSFYQDECISGWRENYVYKLPSGEIVCVYRDRTENIKAEEERNKLNAELHQAQKLEAIGTLSAGIAHEINTPIQYINDNTHFLSDEIGKLLERIKMCLSYEKEENSSCISPFKGLDMDFLLQEIPAAFKESKDGLSRVTEIIQAMRSFSHIDQKLTCSDINQAILNTMTVCRNEWKYVADIDYHLEEKLEHIECYINDIQQSIMNIVINASHAIETKIKDSNDKKGKITIETRNEMDKIVITISDNGCGIPMEIQNKIFNPFFTTKEVGKGTGQGLSIAYSTIVKKHNGEINVVSSETTGTTISITLPIKQSLKSKGTEYNI